MKYIDKREVEGAGVVEHTVVLKQKKIFLDLDMQTLKLNYIMVVTIAIFWVGFCSGANQKARLSYLVIL